nr:unnamed protein product [Spirometra erinaceieuropaei]
MPLGKQNRQCCPNLCLGNDRLRRGEEQILQGHARPPGEQADRLIDLVDFNARVGTDCTVWKGVLVSHGVRDRSDDSFLLRIDTDHPFLPTNTSRLLVCEEATWVHQLSRRWQLLDYVLVRRRDREGMLVTKATRDADGWTDYRLAIFRTKLRMQLRRGSHDKRTEGKLNIVLTNVPTHYFYLGSRLT